MHTLTSARPCCHEVRLRIPTSAPVSFIDLTERLDRLVADSHIRTGTLTVQTLHTTTAVVVNEREPLLQADFEALLARLAPPTGLYHHDDMSRRIGVPSDEPANGHAHCQALLLPVSATLTIVNGRLRLGRWQRVFLVELDGPRTRDVSVVVMGEAGWGEVAG